MRRTVVLLVAVLLSGFWMMPGGASSHREAPLISLDPSADNTDVYVARSPTDPSRVYLISNFIPLELANAGPNFYRFDPNVVYEIMVDNNGDAIEDVTFQWRFTTEVRNPNTFLYNTGQVTSTYDEDLNVRQFYSVARIDGPRRIGVPKSLTSSLLTGRIPVAPANVGPRSMPNYGGQTFEGSVNGVGDYVVFAGPRDEGFYVDLGVFDLLGVGSGAIEGSTDGYNVHSIAIEMPISLLTSNGTTPTDPADPAAVIGVWSTASRYATTTRSAGSEVHSGDLVQVSRLGQPLVNEVVIPIGVKDTFNSLEPKDDGAALSFVTNPIVPPLLNLVFGISVPPVPRDDLVTIFLKGIPGLNQPANVTPSEQLRLNVAIPVATTRHRLGVLGGDNQGFPNGRRVGDDVFDVAVRAMAGATPLTPAFNVAPNNTLGDGVDQNDLPYFTTFPYLAHPWPGNK